MDRGDKPRDDIGVWNSAPTNRRIADQLHPVVLPHVSHFKQVPFLTSVKLLHSGQASPS